MIDRKHLLPLACQAMLLALARSMVAAAGRHVYLYLLCGATIDHANQVRSTDITYIPMA